jgi:hypothetical protein
VRLHTFVVGCRSQGKHLANRGVARMVVVMGRRPILVVPPIGDDPGPPSCVPRFHQRCCSLDVLQLLPVVLCVHMFAHASAAPPL